MYVCMAAMSLWQRASQGATVYVQLYGWTCMYAALPSVMI
jgi:hypothetical protein